MRTRYSRPGRMNGYMIHQLNGKIKFHRDAYMGSILLGAVLEKKWMHPGRTSASMHPHPDVRHLSHIPHLMAHASIAQPLIWLLHSPDRRQADVGQPPISP